jgi:hypothetical protein
MPDGIVPKHMLKRRRKRQDHYRQIPAMAFFSRHRRRLMR